MLFPSALVQVEEFGPQQFQEVVALRTEANLTQFKLKYGDSGELKVRLKIESNPHESRSESFAFQFINSVQQVMHPPMKISVVIVKEWLA